MHEKFREGQRAAAYVGSGVMSNYPDRCFRVRMTRRGSAYERICKARDVGHVVLEFCQLFPKASVYYYPGAEDRVVAEVRCHCSHERTGKCCCTGGYHHAKVDVFTLSPDEVAALAPDAIYHPSRTAKALSAGDVLEQTRVHEQELQR